MTRLALATSLHSGYEALLSSNSVLRGIMMKKRSDTSDRADLAVDEYHQQNTFLRLTPNRVIRGIG